MNNKKMMVCFLAVFMMLTTSLASAGTSNLVFGYQLPECQETSLQGDKIQDTCKTMDVIYSFDSPGSHPTGLTWIGNYLWNADSYSYKLYKIDPSDGNVIKSYNIPLSICSISGITWDGEYLWIADSQLAKIFKIYIGTIKLWIMDSFSSPGGKPKGLTWDGEYLWNVDCNTDKLYKITSNGNIVDSFDITNYNPSGLAWDGEYLWNADYNYDKISKIDPSDGSNLWTISSPNDWPQGLAWDGEYLWNADSTDGNEKIYKIDVEDNLPIACYTWEDADGDGPETIINFDASCSTDDKGIIGHAWDWTSDGTYDDFGTIVSHDYGNTDNHYCTLKVTDTTFQTDAVTKFVHASAINESILNACYTWEDADGNGPGAIINFDASCSTGGGEDIISYEWDWDCDWIYDETGKITSHDYVDSGYYGCMLKITNAINQTDIVIRSIHATVGDGEDTPPNACYDWEDVDASGSGTLINFDASCSTDDEGIVSYEWDWTSDGTYDDTGMIKTHDYGDISNHDCTLRVTDTIGQTGIITKTVHADIEGTEILFSEDFEDGKMPPSGWTVINGNKKFPWTIANVDEYPDVVYNGDYSAYVPWSYETYSDNSLITPKIDLDCPNNIKLKFWAYSTTKWPGATIELHIKGNGFDDVIWNLIEDENWQERKYREMTFDLTGYKYSTIQIEWRYIGINGDGFGLDDITVIDPPDGGYVYQETQQQSVQDYCFPSVYQQGLKNVIYNVLHFNI